MLLHSLSTGPHLTLGCSRYLLITVKTPQWPLLSPALSFCRWCAARLTQISSRGNPGITQSSGGGGVKRQTGHRVKKSRRSPVHLLISSQPLGISGHNHNQSACTVKSRPTQTGYYRLVQFMGLILTRACDVIGKINLHKLIQPTAVKRKHTAEENARTELGSGPGDKHLKSTYDKKQKIQ